METENNGQIGVRNNECVQVLQIIAAELFLRRLRTGTLSNEVPRRRPDSRLLACFLDELR
jgi:hypothetical protein